MNTTGKSGPASNLSLQALCVLALAVYFWASAFSGLTAYFTGDDAGNLLNMHRYFSHSLWYYIGSSASVISPAYRPLGGIFYFVVYSLFGYDPLPFHAVCLSLLFVNVLLAFDLMRRLSGSWIAAMMGAILIVHHPVTLELLYSSGTIYEILCFFFYCLTLRVYFVWRQEGRRALSFRQTIAILALTGCALDSKEMAMTLPGALLLLELVYFRPSPWSWRDMKRQALVPLATAVLVIPTLAVKVFTSNPLSNDKRYQHHSLHATLDAMRAYHHFLLYGPLSSQGLSLTTLLLLWAVASALASKLHSRAMQYGLVLVIIAMLPICLIAPRGGYMAYIPLVGWALYCGSLFDRLTDGLVQRFEYPLKFAAFAALAALIVNTHASLIDPYANQMLDHQHESQRIIDRLRTIHPRLRRGASMLLVDDPAVPSFELLFLARIAYHDPTLELDRTKILPAVPSGPDVTHYDFILAGGWDFHDVRAIDDPRPPVEVSYETQSVRIPELSGQTVDLLTASGVQHCALDLEGRCAVTGSKVRWIRPQDSAWMAAGNPAQ